MKKTLLFAFGLLSMFAQGQSAITSYLGEVSGESSYFLIVTSDTPINQTSGANQVWNFNQLTEVGGTGDFFSVPTQEQSTEFPGTTRVLHTYGNPNEANIDAHIFTNGSNLTGFQTFGLTLNYLTNNANLGVFPMSFGYTHSDASAGTYEYGDYSGTFTGTINTEIDAYGTLNTNIGSNTQNLAVTRLKTVQNISLNYGFLPNVGTIILTTYSYYANTIGVPPLVFRTSTVSVVVGLLGIDQTSTQMENYEGSLLAAQNPGTQKNTITIAPNPASNILNIELSGQQQIQSVVLTDSSGKQVVIVENDQKSIDISSFQKGIYFVQIKTDSGTFVRKIVKE